MRDGREIQREDVKGPPHASQLHQRSVLYQRPAKLLGLTFRTLQYRLEKFGFKKDGDGTEEPDES